MSKDQNVAKLNRRQNTPSASADTPKKPTARRECVTLTPFQWWQIDGLKDIYAPTVPEILRRIVLEWLELKHDKIEQQKREHLEFKKLNIRETKAR